MKQSTVRKIGIGFNVTKVIFIVMALYMLFYGIDKRSFNPFVSKVEYKFEAFETNVYLADSVHVSDSSLYVIDLMNNVSIGV